MTKIIKSPKQDLKLSGVRSADHYRRMAVARELNTKQKPVTLPRVKFLENAK